MKQMLHKILLASVVLISTSSAMAQSQVYFREGFNEGEGTIPTTAAEAQPAQYRFQNNSGTWYIFGVYRTTGTTGACVTETGTASHIRFANINTTDSAYLVTPLVNSGINTLTFLNGRASRRFTIEKTTDTAANTANWTFVTFLPATNTACQLMTVTVNDPAARRLRLVARAGTDSDIDSLVMTSSTAIMPVKFTGLSALESSGKVKLNWKIATEINTAKYVVERSSNGVTFTDAGDLQATNSSNYNWVDNTPANGNNYYRIKGVDKDGIITYSTVVRVSVGRKNLDFNIAPNPVRNKQVNVQVANLQQGTYRINVFNSVGQQVYAKSVTHLGGSATYQIELPTTVKAGIYNLQLQDGETILNKKLVVE
jgi:hypothetical protein